MLRPNALLLIAVFITGLFAGCAPTREAAEEPGPAEEIEVEEAAVSALLSASDLDELRLSPSDRFLALEHIIPESFRLTEDDLREIDTNAGYRIQLLSTQDINRADDVRLEYYDWASEFEQIPFDRTPEAYVDFRPPYYRVRIGDFQRRNDANTYLAILRVHFPGAWVVMDTIDPDLAP